MNTKSAQPSATCAAASAVGMSSSRQPEYLLAIASRLARRSARRPRSTPTISIPASRKRCSNLPCPRPSSTPRRQPCSFTRPIMMSRWSGKALSPRAPHRHARLARDDPGLLRAALDEEFDPELAHDARLPPAAAAGELHRLHPLGLRMKLSHVQRLELDPVAPQPRLGLAAVLLEPAGDDVADRALGDEQRLDVAPEARVPGPVVVFLLRVVAAEHAVEVEAPAGQSNMLLHIPGEGAGPMHDLEPHIADAG